MPPQPQHQRPAQLGTRTPCDARLHGNDDAAAGAPCVDRWVDIVQVAPVFIVESKPDQVELMKSSIINCPVRLDVGNWRTLELICGRPVHRGFSPNDKADLGAMLAGNPDDVVGVEPFAKGASS